MAGIYLVACFALALVMAIIDHGFMGLIAFAITVAFYIFTAYFLEKLVYPEREKRSGDDHRKN